MPVFCKMYRLASLIRQRRAASSSGSTMNDEMLLDVVRSAEQLESELEEERQRIDALVKGEFGLVCTQLTQQQTRKYNLTGICTKHSVP